jgi:hypothetical protein
MRNSWFLVFNFFIIFFQASSLWAAPTVRAPDLSNVAVYVSTESDPTVGVVYDLPASGSGEDKENPLIVYIPLDGDSDQLKHTLFANPAFMPKKIGDGTTTFKITLRLNNSEVTDHILNVGVEDGTDNSYEPFALTNTLAERTIAANSTSDVIFRFTLDSMCSETDCADIQSTVEDRDESFDLHFFLDTVNQTSSHTGTENGFYIQLKFSDRVPENSFTLDRLIKGDERLVAQLSGGDAITQMGTDAYRIYVHRYPEANTTTQPVQALGDASGAQLGDLDAVILSGNLTVKNLTNRINYNLAFALANKYLFVSELSNSLVGTPEDILSLLESQACFLLSAGFQREHPVLETYRWIRDNILLRFAYGKMFVESYYRLAPPIAGIIYQDPILSALVRFGSVLFLTLLAMPFLYLLRHCWRMLR